MKLRYLFVTLLAVGILACGVLWLVAETLQTTNRPLLATAVNTKEATPVAQKKDPAPAADTTGEVERDTLPSPAAPVIDTLPPAAIAVADTLGAAPAADSNMYDAQKLRTIQRKYAGKQPAVWSDHVEGMVYRVALPESAQRVVFLTFNAYTKDYPALFELLQQHNIKATLFLTGNWVRRNTEQARKIGTLPSLFEIGNHGNRNTPLSVNGAVAYDTHTGTGSLAEAFAEITNGADAIKNATGRNPRYVRPFLNYADNVVIDALRDASIKTVGATTIADGGGIFGAEKIKDQILNAPNGAILLLNVNPDYPNILRGLQAAIEAIEKEKLPIRFEQLAGYEQYFEYIP